MKEVKTHPKTIDMSNQKESDSWIFNDSEIAKTKENLTSKIATHDYADLLQKIENDSSIKDEVIKQIQEAKLSDIEGMTDAFKQDLNTVIQKVMGHALAIGGKFDNLRKFNEIEKGIIDSATRRLTGAEQGLKSAESVSDNWWNRTFAARVKKIAKAQQALADAQAAAAESKTKAEVLFNDRLRDADISQGLQQFLHMSAVAQEILTENAKTCAEQADVLEAQHKQAQSMFEQTAGRKTTLEAELGQLEEKLKEAVAERANYTKGTPEAAQHEEKISAIQVIHDNKRIEFDRMLAIHNSKERFVNIIMTDLTALKKVRGTLLALTAQLRSDTEERVHTYEAVLRLIQASKTQEIGSAIEKIGVETDQKNIEIATAITSAALKDAEGRLLEHPERMKAIYRVMEAMTSISERSRKILDSYKEMLKEGYGGESKGTGDGGGKKSETEDVFADLQTK
jgi:hypothetical protein